MANKTLGIIVDDGAVIGAIEYAQVDGTGMADYHSRIMNIQIPDGEPRGRRLDYKYGHKDARHAAAEIANEADRRIAELEAQLADARDYNERAPKLAGEVDSAQVAELKRQLAEAAKEAGKWRSDFEKQLDEKLQRWAAERDAEVAKLVEAAQAAYDLFVAANMAGDKWIQAKLAEALKPFTTTPAPIGGAREEGGT